MHTLAIDNLTKTGILAFGLYLCLEAFFHLLWLPGIVLIFWIGAIIGLNIYKRHQHVKHWSIVTHSPAFLQLQQLLTQHQLEARIRIIGNQFVVNLVTSGPGMKRIVATASGASLTEVFEQLCTQEAC